MSFSRGERVWKWPKKGNNQKRREDGCSVTFSQRPISSTFSPVFSRFLFWLMTMRNSLINWFCESPFSSLEKTLTLWDFRGSQRQKTTISLLGMSERSFKVFGRDWPGGGGILSDRSGLTMLAAAGNCGVGSFLQIPPRVSKECSVLTPYNDLDSHVLSRELYLLRLFPRGEIIIK